MNADARISRREWLAASSALAAAAVTGCTVAPEYHPPQPTEGRRVVFVRFGGGVRYADVFGRVEDCLAPTTRALALRGTLATEFYNSHLTRHDAATLYLLSGRYGRRVDSNEKAPLNFEEMKSAALVHEAFRRATQAPIYKTLTLGLPEYSAHPLHGANVRSASFANHVAPTAAKALPPGGDRSLATPTEWKVSNDFLARIVSEITLTEKPLGPPDRRKSVEKIVDALLQKSPPPCAALVPAFRSVLIERALAPNVYIPSTEIDSWLTDLALAAMADVRPDLVEFGFVTPDLAHSGAWSDYASAVAQVDQQVRRIIEFIDRDDYYRGRTLLLIAPDVGRGDLDFTEHEQPFADAAHRRLFLLAYGHGVDAGRTIEKRVEQTALAPTIAAKLGFTLGQAESEPIAEMLT